MFGYEDEASSVPAEDKEAEAIIEEETTGALPASLQDETIISPIVGQAVALSDVNGWIPELSSSRFLRWSNWCET